MLSVLQSDISDLCMVNITNITVRLAKILNVNLEKSSLLVEAVK